MPPRAAQKEESRARILASAGRGFRAHGYGGLGVDGLAREAGVTSGAFYGHFASKAVAFRDAVAAGMAQLREGIAALRAHDGEGWRQAFVDFYLTERVTCDAAESCALQSLTGEVARAGADARAAYTLELRRVIEAADEGSRAQAIALLALLSGGVSMARAVDDPELAREIVRAVRSAAEGLARR